MNFFWQRIDLHSAQYVGNNIWVKMSANNSDKNLGSLIRGIMISKQLR